MKDEEFILGLILSYSKIIAQGVPKNSDNEIWVKPCCDMYKIISKRKIPQLTEIRSINLLANYDKIQKIDIEYFKDMERSPFAIAILLLNYAIKENSCLFCRSKLSQIDTMKYIEELERSEQWRGLIKSHHRYLTLLIENV
jgi:hypothetical protein